MAAVLKAYGLFFQNDALLGSRALLAGVVSIELVLAATFVAGRHLPLTRLVALMFFGCLALIAFAEAATGYTSCGCFGPVQVSPWFTVAFDLIAVSVLLLMGDMAGDRSTSGDDLRGACAHAFHEIIDVALPGILLCLAFLAVSQGIVAERSWSKTAILEPRSWLGKPLPILKQIDIGNELESGKWLILLFRRDCPRCNEELPVYGEMAQEAASVASTLRFAAIELPPQPHEAMPSRMPAADEVRYGRVIDGTGSKWFVTVPTTIYSVDGRVEGVVEGELDTLDQYVVVNPFVTGGA